ncbi:MAG TPA: lipase maturation factor family protein, partial [Myxococcota bacterium]|nr:lipase maturation factor family protein [Myxococcota bacterium]
MPLSPYLDRVAEHLGSRAAGFWALPSLFWIDSSDLALRAVAWTGFALSCAVVAGYANSIGLAALWALYMSIVHAGQDWYGYGWEIQL